MGEHNLLTAPLVRVALAAGGHRALSLPDLYAALMADGVAAFPALRPHQRHAWHAFLAQVGALALHAAGADEPPGSADAWRALLRGLTPDFADDAPWSLVAPPDRPALLQAPLPEGTFAPLKNVFAAPDEIDMLVTAKNHDLKAARMAAAEPDEWLFALAQLQTCEGFLGAGNYGVSRMNGGFSNRPGIGVTPPGGPGARLRRDIRQLLALRDEIVETYGYRREGGLGLVWLAPWDGAAQVRLPDLDPFYVEICRRLRLVAVDGRIAARGTGTKAARIAMPKELNGITGDPWAPLDESDGKARKALTVDGRGFEYGRLARIIFQTGFRAAPLQRIAADDPHEGLTLVCRALVRGQGKTEGLHERIVPISATGAGLLRRGMTDPLARLAGERIDDAGRVSQALRRGLMMLFQNGPASDAFKRDHRASAERARPFLVRFDDEVDRGFFDALWLEVEHAAGSPEATDERRRWLRGLRDTARGILRAAATGSPTSTVRHYRARARAEGAFEGAFERFFPWVWERADAA